MIKNSTVIDKSKNNTRVKRGDSMKIDTTKLRKFCNLWSMNVPKETIQQELNIKKVQYYNYINAAEEIVDDFLLGMVDHGLVLQFQNTLQDIQQRREQMNKISKRMLEKYQDKDLDNDESIILTRVISMANQTDKLFNEMLDDTKIVNQTVKTLNKVIVKSKLNN